MNMFKGILAMVLLAGSAAAEPTYTGTTINTTTGKATMNLNGFLLIGRSSVTAGQTSTPTITMDGTTGIVDASTGTFDVLHVDTITAGLFLGSYAGSIAPASVDLSTITTALALKVDRNTPAQVNLSTVTTALALKADIGNPAHVDLSTVTTALAAKASTASVALKVDKDAPDQVNLSTVTTALALKADKGNTAHVDLSTVTTAIALKADSSALTSGLALKVDKNDPSQVNLSTVTTALALKQDADADLTDLADGTLTGSKVGTGIVAANVAAGTFADGVGILPTGVDLSTVTTALGLKQDADADLTDLADGSLTGSKVGSGVAAANIAAGTFALGVGILPSGVDLSTVTTALGGKQDLDADLTDLADGSLTGSKVGSGVPAANIADGTMGTVNTGGNAATATALAADGANCSAGSYPLGVDAGGAVQSCGTAITGNAGTATALAANGANCAGGQYPLGVDASGAAESCTAAGVGDAVLNSTQTWSGTNSLMGLTGLNDTTPDAQLDIKSNATEGGYIVSVSSQNDTVGNIFAIKGNGYVGVGNNAPSSLFQIKGLFNAAAVGYNLNGGFDYGMLTIISTNIAAVDVGASIVMGGNNGAATYGFGGIKCAKELAGANYAGYCAFYTNKADSVGGEKFRISSEGGLLVGSQTPSAMLVVKSTSGNITNASFQDSSAAEIFKVMPTLAGGAVVPINSRLVVVSSAQINGNLLVGEATIADATSAGYAQRIFHTTKPGLVVDGYTHDSPASTVGGEIGLGFGASYRGYVVYDGGNAHLNLENTYDAVDSRVQLVSRHTRALASTMTWANGALTVSAPASVAATSSFYGSTFTVTTAGLVSAPSQPYVKTQRGAAMDVANSVLSAVFFDTNLGSPTGGMIHSITAASATITVPVTGRYSVNAQSAFATMTNDKSSLLYVLINTTVTDGVCAGGTVLCQRGGYGNGAGDLVYNQCNDVYPLAANDTLTMCISQASGSVKSTQPGVQYNSMTVYKVP